YGFSRQLEEFAKQNPVAPGRGTIIGRVALEGKTVHIPDVLADPEYTATDYQRLGGYRSNLAVPLLREGVPIGVFALTRPIVKPFTEKQIELVTTFADQAVIAIENVRLFDTEQQRTRELTEALEQQTATSEILQVISSSPGDLQPVFETIVANATRLCEANFGNMYLRDGETFQLAATHNTPLALVEERRRTPLRRRRDGALARMFETRQVVH